MRRVSLNPLRAIGRWAAYYSSAMVLDALRATGSTVHAAEARTQGQIRGFEERQLARDGMILAELAELRRERADFRAAHHFVGDRVTAAPSVSDACDRLVPRHPPARGRDTRPPLGRHHP